MALLLVRYPGSMKKHLLIILVLLGIQAHAQKASIKRVEVAGQKIIVHYDLEDSNPANEYHISLYSSQSNFQTALTRVKGDVGNEIKPGSDKKIEWNIVEELGPYKGKLSLEVRGRMFVPVAKISNISTGARLKRGKSHLLVWRPGNNNPVNIELLKGDQPVSSQPHQPNNGSLQVLIPPHMEIGNDYSFRITDSRDPGNSTQSPTFAVTRKVPLLFKVLPVVVVGGVVAVLTGSGGGGGDDPGGRRGEIELPPLPQ